MSENKFEPNGVLIVNKPQGITSHDVVGKIRKLYGTRKVGHTGTLDPLATGVLVILLGRAAKAAEYLVADRKTYIARLTLGITTDTEDITGKILTENDNIPSADEVVCACGEFLGKIKQIPPMYSALKVDGKKLYDLAREGIEVEREARDIEIFRLDLTPTDKVNEYELLVECSSGTYIRTLGVDIAKKLNNDGCLSSLRRISIGGIKVDDANSFKELEEQNVRLIDIKDALRYKKLYINDPRILKRVYNGQNIILKQEVEDDIIIVDNDKAVAIYKRDETVFFKCVRGLYDEDIRLERLKSL